MASVSTLSSIFDSWHTSAQLHTLNPGASDAEIATIESILERTLPAELKDLYKHTNGAYLLEGNLNIYPLDGQDLSLAKATITYQQSEWPIPDEVVVLGNNGQGEPFGIWLSKSEDAQPAIIEIGEIFESGSMAIVGSSLGPFLLSRTAYYLLLEEAGHEPLDVISVPMSLRSDDPDDDDFIALI